MRGFYAIPEATPQPLDVGGDAPDGAGRRAPHPLPARSRRLAVRGNRAARGAAPGPAPRLPAPCGGGAARRLLALCRGAGVPFCVNDRMDVALAVGADVVHLGQDDLPLADARRVRAAAGRPDLVIGVSTHNRAQAVAAAEAGADYIGFGPVFGTRTKLNPDPTVGLDILAAVCSAVAVPVVAIGGIALEAVAAVARAGASAAAIIAAIEAAPDPTAAGRAVASAFA